MITKILMFIGGQNKMKCDVCRKRIWFWRFRSSRNISGAIAHNKCWDKPEKNDKPQ